MQEHAISEQRREPQSLVVEAVEDKNALQEAALEKSAESTQPCHLRFHLHANSPSRCRRP